MPCRIVNSHGYYLAAVHGTNYLSWVEERDKAFAMVFNTVESAQTWISVLSAMTDLNLRAIPCV